MRAGFGLAVGVLAAVLAGSGCCKLCDWCRGDRPRDEGPPPRQSNAVGNPPFAGQMTQPSTAPLPAGSAPAGAYNQIGN